MSDEPDQNRTPEQPEVLWILLWLGFFVFAGTVVSDLLVTLSLALQSLALERLSEAGLQRVAVAGKTVSVCASALWLLVAIIMLRTPKSRWAPAPWRQTMLLVCSVIFGYMAAVQVFMLIRQ
jgi:hypothetical protein